MRHMTFCIAFVCCTMFTLIPAHAQESQYLIDHVIQSMHPKEQRKISVNLPGSYYSQSEYKYPVLFVLDGEANLSFTTAVAEYLAVNGLIPEMIVVGVHAGANRDRDYVPVAGGETETNGPSQFLQYLDSELIPFMDKKYRCAPLRLLSGHSYGGLLAFFSMVNAPNLFDGYLIQSPYVDQTKGGPVVKRLEAHWSMNENESHPFTFMNLGEEPDLESNFSRIESLMKSHSNDLQRLISHREQGKTHMTTRMVGIYDGLEAFFQPDWAISDQTLMTLPGSGVADHVAKLSKKYGYDVLYNKEVLAKAIQISLSKQDFGSGLKLSNLLVKQRPNSTLGHFLLAVCHASTGDRQAAKKSIETAIRLYEDNPEPNLEPLLPQMKAMQSQLR